MEHKIKEGASDAETRRLFDGDEEPAGFEKAITAAGWGRFNVIVYVLSITSGWSSVFETSTMSYVFPAAECDLDLLLSHKGLLNSATYIGMISSGFIWGYLCDTLGRKKLLVVGFLLDALFVILGAASQNFAMLVTAKFFGGFIINGPFTALTTYLSELHSAKQRARVQMVLGVIFSLATVVVPILALYVLPMGFKAAFGDHFVIHSWNLYMFICACVPLTSGVAFMFLPESPKFLMTTGKNEKALAVFRKIYRINTGNPEETYPIKKLVDEIELNRNNKHAGKMTANRSKLKAVTEGFSQIRPLFLPPHLPKIVLICCIQFFTMSSLNTLRLWLPQLFQAVNDFEQSHNESASLCEMLAVFRPKTRSAQEEGCVVNMNNMSVYVNSIVIAVVSVAGYVLAGLVINKVGKKWLYIFLASAAGVSSMSLFVSRNTATTIALAALFVTTGSVMINTLLAIIVDLFPTTLRAFSVAIAMMCGRTGAALGNVLFPYLLQTGCAPPFFTVGGAMIACAAIGCLLPHTDNKALRGHSAVGIVGAFRSREMRGEGNRYSGGEKDDAADFQTAVSATGFGKFNYVLLAICLPATWTTQYETTGMSFVVPAAACDLDLTSTQKGLLNSMTFVGMVTSGCVWGFLLDTLGRRKVVLIGYGVESLLVFATSFAPNFAYLVVCKFCSGAVSGGLYVAINTYLQEFHATEYRGKIQMAFASMYCAANVAVPLTASLFLPLDVDARLFGAIDYHAWNLFILVGGVFSVVSTVCFYMMPESPKFLMSAGDNDAALAVFRKVYSANSGNSAKLYPIRKLIDETIRTQEKPAAKDTPWTNYFRTGWRQTAPLFGRTHFPRLVLVCVVQGTFQMSINAWRLYMPQVFQAIHEHQAGDNESSDLCAMMAGLKSSEPGEMVICSVNMEDNFAVYLNCVITAIASIAGYAGAGALINTFGRRHMLNVLTLAGVVSATCMYFAKNIATILTLSSVYLAATSVCYDIIVTIVVAVFPTTLRALAFSFTMMSGRSLTVVGNMIMPILVDLGCAPPFLTLGAFLTFALLLSCLLPDTDHTDLK
ncbi:uncharacterized protein LOC132700796 [Cylas formicarius]|uniref:uncharacterized protein LOC132700796 n=1 Tax=Cylas formicarius TaxID=197179 RepID=UPI0029588B04|nr:uncharacterized protein LOC132700796 [Cylas formicarius]